MAAKLPLYLPVTIAERRVYTAKIYLCDTSAELDYTKLSAFMVPVFGVTTSIVAFEDYSASKPKLLTYSSGEAFRPVNSYQAYAASELNAEFPAQTYPVMGYVQPISLPSAYSHRTVTVTFNQGAQLPPGPNYGNPFYDSTAPHFDFIWTMALNYDNGERFELVAFSPVKITIAEKEAEKKREDSTLSICSGRVE